MPSGACVPDDMAVSAGRPTSVAIPASVPVRPNDDHRSDGDPARCYVGAGRNQGNDGTSTKGGSSQCNGDQDLHDRYLHEGIPVQ